MRHLLALFAAALLFGCGSDSGGAASGTGIQEKLLYTNLGTVRGDEPTITKVQVAKPFYHEGTVELAEPPTGPFAPAEGMLPARVEAGHESTLWLSFTPPSGLAAAQEGTIRLHYRRVGSSSIYPVTLQLRAEVESPSARLLAAQASAGSVIVGETRAFSVYIENTSKVTPIYVTGVTPPDGDFSIAPDAFPLPAPVGPGSRLPIRLQYTPQNLGNAFSSIQIFHSAAAAALEATLTGVGVEMPSARLLETAVSAGNVVVGEEIQVGLDFENTSAETPVTVTGVTIPAGEFSLAPGFALPAVVAAGATLHIPLSYAPQGEWDASALVQVHHSADTVPLEATVTGTGIPARLYFDYVVSLDPSTSESDWITVDVPAEAVSLFLEATGEPWLSLVDLVELRGPGDVVYESYGSGPLDWASFYPAGGLGYLNVELPNSDAPGVQLVPGGGTYAFRLRDSNYWASALSVRVTVSLRTGGVVDTGTLDLRIFLADGLGLYDPMGDAKFAEVVRTIDAVLGMSGIRLGNVWFNFTDPYYDTLWDSWMAEEMFAVSTAGYSEGALNLFFVADMSWWGVAGISGAAPGPTANGTIYSGVAIDFNASDGITVGTTAAHEIGHYLGHLVAGHEEVLLSESDAYPALRHPLLNPGLPTSFFSPPETTDEAQILAAIDLMGPMDSWCGTCTRWPVR